MSEISTYSSRLRAELAKGNHHPMAHIIPNFADSSYYPEHIAALKAFVTRPDYKQISPHIIFKEWLYLEKKGLQPLKLVKFREEKGVVLMKIDLLTEVPDFLGLKPANLSLDSDEDDE